MRCERRNRPFLARPFWRDYVVAYAMLGAGILVSDVVTFPAPIIGLVLLLIGVAILLSALSHSLAFAIGGRRRRQPPGCCIACGYNLTGNLSGVCPECGTPARREGEAGES